MILWTFTPFYHQFASWVIPPNLQKMSRIISKLSKLLSEGASNESIEAHEELIIDEIEKHVKDASFYSLPTEEIVRIIEKSSINDAKLLMELTQNMSNNKGKDAVLLLNVISSEEATFEECVKIISNFSKCPLLKRLGNLFNSDAILPERDYQYEIDELKKEIEEHKKIPKTSFPPMAKKPNDFESDIHKAAEKGKLTSVQYLVEQCHANVEAKGEYGRTPLINASNNGHLDVVKYLVEECHAKITEICGNYEIKRYLESKKC